MSYAMFPAKKLIELCDKALSELAAKAQTNALNHVIDGNVPAGIAVAKVLKALAEGIEKIRPGIQNEVAVDADDFLLIGHFL